MRPERNLEAGFTLLEMMITLAITMLIMAGTMRAMSDAMRASELAQATTSMNQGLRTAIDIMARDMLQVGQGLPSGRTINLPNGGAEKVRLPGPPDKDNTVRELAADTPQLTAIVPGPGLGPEINGVKTDIITFILADGAFLSTISDYDVNLTELKEDSMTVDPSVDITNGGADDLKVGDLIMLMKSTSTALVQVSAVSNQTVTFTGGDSLNLNQSSATRGTLKAHVAKAPAEVKDPKTGFVPSTATRIRMITYYIDNITDPDRPRLVRRINNGDWKTYNNKSGTALAFDVENLQISYDLVNAATNPADVKFTAADLDKNDASGRCYTSDKTSACSPNQIRKINISLSGRSRKPMRQTQQYVRNTLTTQISLRSMSFIDRYR